MQKQLDSTDIKIVEALGVYGPRNITGLAKKIGIHAETVRDRIQRLKSHFYLLLETSIYHTYLGLKKAFIFAKANPGYEQVLWECLKAEGYWLYLAACYGIPESCYGIYGIPIDHTAEFEHFLREIVKLKVAQDVKLFWSTCIHTVNLTKKWFDGKTQSWVFKWNEWIQNIQTQGTQLPPTLIEAESYPQKADKIDIIILKELQKDATQKLCDIAEMLNVPPQTVQYHFSKHVIGKELIEGFAVFLPFFGMNYDNFCFRFSFKKEEDMAKFALSLRDKPFARGIAKIFGENALFVRMYLPREEFRPFLNALSKLIGNGLLKSYDFIIEDPSKKLRQTISYEFFKDCSWTYNHEEHMKKLQELVTNRT